MTSDTADDNQVVIAIQSDKNGGIEMTTVADSNSKDQDEGTEDNPSESDGSAVFVNFAKTPVHPKASPDNVTIINDFGPDSSVWKPTVPDDNDDNDDNDDDDNN